MKRLSRIYYVALKDIRAYYLKPPLISWGFIFPGAIILAFYLRNPSDFGKVIPGLVGITLLFGATSMEAIAITFEKRVGALERLLMAPMTAGDIVLAKLLSGLTFGTMTGALVILAAVWVLGPAKVNPPFLLLFLLLSAAAFSALGELVSVLVREVFEAMTLANFFRFPMIFISGVFTPLPDMPPVLRGIALLSPLTYCVDAFRHLLGVGGELSLSTDLVALAGFAATFLLTAVLAFRRMVEQEY